MSGGGGGGDDEDKTHEPTQRKLDDAFKKGDVAKSMEINTLFVLGGLTLTDCLWTCCSSHAVSGQAASDSC
jgi:flagellar biosynthesis protein FlhB